jgi:hypothetical protein
MRACCTCISGAVTSPVSTITTAASSLAAGRVGGAGRNQSRVDSAVVSRAGAFRLYCKDCRKSPWRGGQGQGCPVALDRAGSAISRPERADLRLQEMGRDAIQRQPSLARSRSEAQKTESRTRNNVQAGRETTSSPGRETTSTSPSKWTRNNVHICHPSWTRNNVHI